MPAPPIRLTLRFDEDALREYQRTETSAQLAFKKKLEKLVSGKEMPSPAHALRGFPRGYYKIKLRRAGLRLVYHYDGKNLVILVIAAEVSPAY